MMKVIHHKLEGIYPKTIAWRKEELVDWVDMGNIYDFSGLEKRNLFRYSYSSYSFDSSIVSTCGQYAFIYKKFGTKGLLLKNDNILREINRSYYYAESYEFPAAFFEKDQQTFLAHCPEHYDTIEFENVETGEQVTAIEGRKADDFFHSRLEVSPDNKYLISKGWVWHPIDTVVYFNIDDCLNNPLILDKSLPLTLFNGDVCTANFINDHLVSVGANTLAEGVYEDEKLALEKNNIGIWNLKNNELICQVKVKEEIGNIIAINETYIWDFYKYPKIINLKTGEIEYANTEINSGTQYSAFQTKDCKQICFNRKSKTVAILGANCIDFLILENY